MRPPCRTALRALTVLTLAAVATGCVDKAVESIQQGNTNACQADQKTVEVAVETFYANGGAPGTATVPGLVSAGLLRAPSASFQVAADGLAVVPIPGGPCDTTGGNGAAAATTALPVAASLTPEQCEADRLTLQGAVDTFGATYNVSPMNEPELVRAGLLPSEVFGYDLQGSTVVPAPGACD